MTEPLLLPLGTVLTDSCEEDDTPFVAIVGLAILPDPKQLAKLHPQQTLVVTDYRSKPALEIVPKAVVGDGPLDVGSKIGKALAAAKQEFEEAQKQRKEEAEAAEKAEKEILSEALADVLTVPEGKADLDRLGVYSLQHVEQAMIERMARGMPLFTNKAEQRMKINPRTPEAWHHLADVLATQLASQNSIFCMRVMGLMELMNPRMYKLVRARFDAPEIYDVSEDGERPRYQTPKSRTTEELEALLPVE